MAKLRTPIFALAFIVILAIVFIEMGRIAPTTVASYLPAFLRGAPPSTAVDRALTVFTPEQQSKLNKLRSEKADELAALEAELSGFGVESLKFVDGFLLFSMALMTLGMLIPDYLQAKVQGCLTAIFAIVVIIFALIKIAVVLAKLITMVAMLLSFPFGTIAYIIIFGSFPRAGANAILSLLFILKFVFGVLLVLAHQRFVENLGLVLFVIVAFVANILVSILYGIVPGFLVSITDAIAAIIVMIIGIILAVVLLIGALISIIFALKPR